MKKIIDESRMVDSETNKTIPIRILNSETGEALKLEPGTLILNPKETVNYANALTVVKVNRAIDREFAEKEGVVSSE